MTPPDSAGVLVYSGGRTELRHHADGFHENIEFPVSPGLFARLSSSVRRRLDRPNTFAQNVLLRLYGVDAVQRSARGSGSDTQEGNQGTRGQGRGSRGGV